MIMSPIKKPNYQILKDKALNEQLITNGYIVLPMLTDSEVSFFRELYKKWHPQDPSEFYKSYFNPNPEYKQEVEHFIIKHFTPRLEEYFVNYIPFGAMFVVKPKGDKGHIPPHQDWSFVDEANHWSLNTWCPLINTENENGNIQMLPGSHFFMESVRGFGTPELYSHLYKAVTPHLVDVPMKAGEAAFFYHGLLHCSTYNSQQDARVSLGLSLVQKNVPLYYHYLAPGEKQADKFLVDTDFYLNYVSYRDKIPETVKFLGKNPSTFSRFTEDEFNLRVSEFISQSTSVIV